jgi:hypothetical protein
MKILRRRVRRSFLFAAIGFLILGFADLARQDYADYGITPLHHFGFIGFCIVQGAIYAAAWFTTRTPSPYRNNWAVIGSLFTLAWAGYDLWLHHTDILAARGGLVGLILAIAGLYVFGQGGSAAKTVAEVAGSVQPASSAPADSTPPTSYQTGFIPPGERIMRSYKIPAEGSKIPAEGSASSPEIAAAAENRNTPRWDPVSFIRSSPPEKSRA